MRKMRMDSFYGGVNLVKHEEYSRLEDQRPSAFLLLTAEAQRGAENASKEIFSVTLCASAVKKYARLNLLYHE